MSQEIQRNAAARLYHNWLTGLVLSLLNHAGEQAAEAFVFALFREQHLRRFLPGLQKLGLADEPDAVAAAKYHYFSNQLGGVKVQYLAESDKKAWVRYPPPRWIWEGTAICAIPTAVNAAMMRGWHAHNGVSLGNPKLGFVCTGMTTDGAPGLEGYYLEYPHPLSEPERLRFEPGEQCPPIDSASLPTLDATTWPPERQAKASLNYAMEYVRNALPLLEQVVGPDQAAFIGQRCARQTGMHSVDFLLEAFSPASSTRHDFMPFVGTLLATDGSQVTPSGEQLVLDQWRLFDAATVNASVLDMFTACLVGMLSVIDRFAKLDCDHQGGQITWRLS